MSKRVIVIGGGIGGLAAAVRLAAAGTGSHLHVTLIEKNARVGGKLNLWEVPHPSRPNDRPFRFDTGPNLLTMPFVFMDLFRAAGEDVRDHLNILRLDPTARFRWDDGMCFDLRGGESDLRESISRISPRDADGWMRLLAKGRRRWELGEPFFTQSPDQITQDRPLLGALSRLTVPLRIGMFTKFDRFVNRYVKHPRLREVLYHYAAQSGASPLRAPAVLGLIPWVEHHFGGFHIEGGMYRLSERLEAIAGKLGVDIHTHCGVRQILVESGRATGVKLDDGSVLKADAVIANSDAVYTYRELIPKEHRPHVTDETLNRIDPGVSGVALMLGVEGTYPQLAHHTRFMPDDYRAGDLTPVFETRTIPPDPCIDVCAPTRTDPALAPQNCEALFILASAPAMSASTIDWALEGPRDRDRLVQTLETRWGLTDLSRRIIVQRMMTPADLMRDYNANAGSIHGIGGNTWRSAFMCPPNCDRKIARLYFTGGATHPGGGLPMAAMSGKIVSELVRQDLSKSIVCRLPPG